MPVTALDRLLIQNEIFVLVCNYALAVDHRDFSALADMFASDAILLRSGAADPSARGKDGIVTYMRNFLDAAPSFHAVHNVVLDFTGDSPEHVEGIVTAHADNWVVDRVVTSAVRYHDAYQRTEGRWLFRSRMLEFPFR